jgi:integration host factor subunit beta
MYNFWKNFLLGDFKFFQSVSLKCYFQLNGHKKGKEKMNKSQLIDVLAQEMNIPLREASPITDTILDTMVEALASGESIEIRGFGSFVVKKYDAYTGRNPKTGASIKVPPKKLPFFKVGKDLKEKVNG